ncbi:unnamed protein product [Penicillium glandicola]
MGLQWAAMYPAGYGCYLHVSVGDFYLVNEDIRNAEKNTSQAEAESYNTTKCRVLGLCTGAFAAAAVSCSFSTLDLLPSAVDAVIAAFRTGIAVTDAAKRVAPRSGDSQSWSIIIPGSVSTEAVPKFNQETILPLTSKPYISAYAPNGITVSGPPDSLVRLIDSEVFKGLRHKSIPIHGPYHASHLYSQLDINRIIDGLAIKKPEQSLSVFAGTGASVEKGNFAILLEGAVRQVLLEPIRWNVILEKLQSWIGNGGATSFTVVPIGTTADQLIYTALKQTSLRTLISAANPQAQKVYQEAHGSPENSKKPKLAIIGMSGRFPDAKDNQAFWDLLYQGLDVHKPVPDLHWNAKTHVDPTGKKKNTSATPFGCWLDDPAGFDARFFNISPREAPQIDPAQRLALMTAYEAIEQAGIVPDMTPSTRRDRVGVFYGVTSNDWMETNSSQNIDTYFIPGGNRAFIPGRINYCFKFSGPSFAVDTACSSSLAGIHIACNSLWRGDIDTAIAGGTNVLTNPDFTAGLDRGHFLSRTGNCKTFDDGADGYCRGEGVGTVIIKRLDDAIADNDPILGVILGASTNHSAESESITRPHAGAQRAIFRKILNQGAVDPYSVSYVEMHGTGTQAGDAGEMSSVLDTFAPPLTQVRKGRTSKETLYLGSAKANIGHGEAASGVSSLIKILLMMQNNTIVPHCGIKTKINHKFPTDLEERNVKIALKPTPWERSSDSTRPRRVFVNNFSAAGGNSALLLEDAPLIPEPVGIVDPRTQHLIAVSAKNGVSLQGNLKSMLDFLNKNQDASLGQLSYTTTARRIHHQHRIMLTGANVNDICGQITAALHEQTGMTRPKSAPKVVFAFTGQGAQYPGMGKDLFDNFSVFRTELLHLDQIAQSLGYPSFLHVIQSQEQNIGIFDPTAVQLGSVCMQIALSKLWASWNIHPTAVVGHSLGEYAALHVAGVLSSTDTVYLVGARAGLLQQKCTQDTHAMLVVKGSADDIAGVLGTAKYEIACRNSPTETVLAGPNDDIADLKTLLSDSGLKSTLLKVPYAFHSSQVEPILDDFKRVAAGASFAPAKIPIICPLDGGIAYDDHVFGPEYLARHTREPVNMFGALEAANRQNILSVQTITLEVGPHPAISGMVKGVLGPQMTCLASYQRARSIWNILASALKTIYEAGADIRWAEYHVDFKLSHKVLPLPAYSWDLKEYWLQYVNDWSLRKGDAPLRIRSGPKLESTTIHRVVEETVDSQKSHIIVEADIAREDLSPLVQGHEVDGIPLCTPSVYADIALSLGSYLIQRDHPDKQDDLLVDVSDMTISKALILRDGATKQLLQAHADIDWSTESAAVKFMSFDTKEKLQQHGQCVVRFKDKSLQEILQKNAAGVKQKMQALREGIALETTARFNRPMVYRAIRPLARFHGDYRAIDEIVLNSTTLEASSRLSFGSVKRGGHFHTHPAIIDSLTQSCGFTMNCNDSTDLDVEVWMNHGWGSFQMYETMDFDKTYSTYTHMEEGEGNLWHGDVVIFDGDRVVAFFGQIAIQAVPRRVLKVILSIESGNKSQIKQTARATAPSQTLLPAPVPGTSEPSKFSQALAIIADESGIAISDFSDGIAFADVGIDSLLGLTISARFKEELDIDIDFDALFNEYPTVSELKTGLGGAIPSATALSTPRSSDIRTATPLTDTTSVTIPDLDGSFSPPKFDFQQALNIISEESGLAIEDFTDDTNFADSGVDSLLSLVIVSRLRDELEFDIQHESLFLECPTVADLKELLLGDTGAIDTPQSSPETKPRELPEIQVQDFVAKNGTTQSIIDKSSLAIRKEAVDAYVEKYTVGFSLPASSPSSPIPTIDENVVLVTGATGSLGGHLIYHMAQLLDVKTIVCLNRENNAEPYARQQKAMREKGIRFPESLKSKLLVFQTDTSKPMFGLTKNRYDGLVNSVTHLIHNAWPMSAKRPLSGFESQFQVMRNLIDFASDVASHRPESFKFSFQMVSSIGVVGHYGLETHQDKTIVPEGGVDIDAVLPNGYGEAKWGCERMLDSTLHKYPARFRTMAVRLGQIAGSKTSGYWNPMEHFGFVIKSSQTLHALPDVPGKLYWTPVNDVAGSLADLLLADNVPYSVYHIENPVGQSWRDMNTILADVLNIPHLIPFQEWVERVRGGPSKNNPASTLLEFLDSNYLRMSCGELVLDAQRTLEHSKTLAAVGPVSEEVVRKYIHIWKEIGFLN